MVGMSVIVYYIFSEWKEFFLCTPSKSLEREVGVVLWSGGTRERPQGLSGLDASLSKPLSFFFCSSLVLPSDQSGIGPLHCPTMIAGVENFSRKLASQDYSKHRSKAMPKNYKGQNIRILNKNKISNSAMPSQIGA